MVVRDVLERSPAKQAGLEPGDTILRYDDKRVFAVGELRHATAQGEPGEFVRIEVAENGGHVGFLAGGTPWRPKYYLPDRIVGFLEANIRESLPDGRPLPGL